MEHFETGQRLRPFHEGADFCEEVRRTGDERDGEGAQEDDEPEETGDGVVEDEVLCFWGGGLEWFEGFGLSLSGGVAGVHGGI